MQKINRWTQNYLVFTFPLVLVTMAWASLEDEREIIASPFIIVRSIWEFMSWNLMLWFFLLIIFLIQLVLIKSVREQVLRRVANIRERDEREAQITGMASKSALLSTLSIAIVMFFISVFNFQVTKIPPEEIIGNKEHKLQIAFQFKLVDEPQAGLASDGTIVQSRDLPLSKASILLILIVWQLASLNIFARKLGQDIS